jgi:hypothetical protein
MLNERAALEGASPADAIADYVQAKRTRIVVIEICEKALESEIEKADEKYWVLATLWEACVGTDDEDRSKLWKAKATQHVKSNELGDWMMDSTETQIAKLKELLTPSPLSRISG